MPIEIDILLGDITEQRVDAIVNPANSSGTMGGGVAAAIRKKGGEQIEREARLKSPIPVGMAVDTTAGTLPCRFIIHAPTMELPAQRTSTEIVSKAVQAALSHAERLKCETLAIPGMGTGVGRVPPESAAAAMISTISGFAGHNIHKVVLVAHDEAMYNAFKMALQQQGGIEE